ncbi:MAG: serine/threonine protein kinase [Myxococcales bacterium]|nr:serine/threonine protein kinase [Myxococcales bacterium]MCB9733031.1 serine/threonine protein kinase [Deltaproteobacteria bacterium]
MTSTPTSPSGGDPNRQRYQIVRKIDAGGMAEIFLAKAMSIQGMEKLVAIKRVLPSLTKNEKFTSMFLDEARLSISLTHANIVSVFDVNQSGGTYFIVMEYVDGYNVRRIFQRASEVGYRIPLALACYMMMEVAKGLEHAHNHRDSNGKPLRIVHRDLSPPNILISKFGEVKITDFGLAKAASQLTRTDPGIVKGKFSYLSPEVTEGKPADQRADIFAAGIVLWELLANRRLFLAKTDVETVEIVRKAEVPPLSKLNPEVTAEFEEIVVKALARDPKKRYTTARELGDALADYLFRHGLKTTSYDLAQMIDKLFGTRDSDESDSHQERIAEMIDEEIANLSMLGFSSAVRGVSGSQPVDPKALAFRGSPRFDLSAFWAGTGPIRAAQPDQGTPSATLRAMDEARTGADLVKMLEGDSTGSVDWPSTDVGHAPSSSSWPLIAIVALVLLGGAAAVYFLVLNQP